MNAYIQRRLSRIVSRRFFYAQSAVDGLYIEAASLVEIKKDVIDSALELIMANHRSLL
jgi:hypothetical protein